MPSRPARTFTRALVTGASSGIGEAMARQLAADGVDLVLVARRTDLLQALADELSADHGVTAEVLTADLTDADALQEVADRLAAEPAVDLLVNNAGFGDGRPFARADLDRQLAMVQIHVTAVVTLTHAAVTAMGGRDGGGVLTVSSMAGFQPLPTGAVYAACKAFETSFSESLRLEQRGRGIHVTAVCPGFTDTAMVTGDKALSRLPRRTLLQVDDVARAGLRGVREDRAVVVPGLAWKAASTLVDVTPRGATRAVLAGAQRLR